MLLIIHIKETIERVNELTRDKVLKHSPQLSGTQFHSCSAKGRDLHLHAIINEKKHQQANTHKYDICHLSVSCSVRDVATLKSLLPTQVRVVTEHVGHEPPHSASSKHLELHAPLLDVHSP